MSARASCTPDPPVRPPVRNKNLDHIYIGINTIISLKDSTFVPDQFWRKVQVTKWGRFEKGPNRAICSDDSSGQQISNQEFSSQKMVQGSPFVNSARLTIPNLQRISEFQGCFYLKGLSHIKQNFVFSRQLTIWQGRPSALVPLSVAP